MTRFSPLNALKGIGGEYEVNRIVGAVGCLAYTVCGNAFVGWSIYRGQEFDLTAYCLAFPAGLGVAVGCIAGAVAIKDRNVAAAKVVQETGSAPGLAAPAVMADPLPVTVTNTDANPVQVENAK